jgi:regulator of protease activity HflC (stomatin/prohibitin superfamily)
LFLFQVVVVVQDGLENSFVHILASSFFFISFCGAAYCVVSVEVSGNLFVRFMDAKKAAYGALNPLYSVTQHAQSAMRSAIGEMELDEILHGRAKLNSLIKGSLQEASEPWGLEIRRYEITEITPDAQIRIAMDKQAAAERDRRERVLRAEGAKRQAELESEGVRISLTNESEGYKTKILLEAQGQAEAIRLTAEAQAQALRVISNELLKPGGQEAARLAVAREYVTMYGEMGKQSNTILFNERPADVSALMAQAMTAIRVVGDVGKNNTTKSDATPSVVRATNNSHGTSSQATTESQSTSSNK